MASWAAVFDLDGVVVDTVPLHFEAWKMMFREYGRAFTFEDYVSKVDGIPRLDGARAVLPDLPDGELERAAGRKQEYFLRMMGERGILPCKGAVELVRMWGLLGHQPEIYFLVTRPERMEPSMELSPALHIAAEQAARLIENLCVNNFVDLERSKDLCIL